MVGHPSPPRGLYPSTMLTYGEARVLAAPAMTFATASPGGESRYTIRAAPRPNAAVAVARQIRVDIAAAPL
jgi:hypothetical protein